MADVTYYAPPAAVVADSISMLDFCDLIFENSRRWPWIKPPCGYPIKPARLYRPFLQVLAQQ